MERANAVLPKLPKLLAAPEVRSDHGCNCSCDSLHTMPYGQIKRMSVQTSTKKLSSLLSSLERSSCSKLQSSWDGVAIPPALAPCSLEGHGYFLSSVGLWSEQYKPTCPRLQSWKSAEELLPPLLLQDQAKHLWRAHESTSYGKPLALETLDLSDYAARKALAQKHTHVRVYTVLWVINLHSDFASTDKWIRIYFFISASMKGIDQKQTNKKQNKTNKKEPTKTKPTNKQTNKKPQNQNQTKTKTHPNLFLGCFSSILSSKSISASWKKQGKIPWWKGMRERTGNLTEILLQFFSVYSGSMSRGNRKNNRWTTFLYSEERHPMDILLSQLSGTQIQLCCGIPFYPEFFLSFIL